MVVLLEGDGPLATLALLSSPGVLVARELSLGGYEAFLLPRRLGISVATELSSTARSSPRRRRSSPRRRRSSLSAKDGGYKTKQHIQSRGVHLVFTRQEQWERNGKRKCLCLLVCVKGLLYVVFLCHHGSCIFVSPVCHLYCCVTSLVCVKGLLYVVFLYCCVTGIVSTLVCHFFSCVNSCMCHESCIFFFLCQVLYVSI
ncbi:uncharacterized protein LOC108836236 isoform X2 [Raphanus sativus]|uniref:Uncharacterized protein LOC108836236 isoform X2 n=1 Tax=Raphanus sativus TaxID=3726 RepID=A0A9W3DQZ8_RAPSA|nr:uncharacterized protein LOC108836236 isoform X2 [Raphanus sativus]